MRLFVIVLSVLVVVMPADGVAGEPRRNGGIGIKVMTYTIDELEAPDRLDDAIKMALLDLKWMPLVAEPGHVVAETTVRLKHYVKIDIKYDPNTVTIELVEMDENLDKGTCLYEIDGKLYRSACIHPAYYDWLEEFVAQIPIASARIDLIRSLSIGAPQ